MHFVQPYLSPLGPITLASNGNELIGLWFEGQKHYAQGLSIRNQVADLPVFDETRRWLDIYFGGQCPDFTPPISLAVSDFRRAVYQALLEIPFGATQTYAQVSQRVAALLGREHMSAQATGGAIGRNPISIIIPCHRVIGTDGSLTGYAGGLDRKRSLLALESIPTHTAP